MAHYAFLDENNIVTSVITGKDEGVDGVDWEEYYSNIKNQTCKRTSYNTKNNVHLNNGVAFRGNYASKGYSYDVDNDVFIPPKPYDSWLLDENIWDWVAPVEYPNDANKDMDTLLPIKVYVWSENSLSWELHKEYVYNVTTQDWEEVVE